MLLTIDCGNTNTVFTLWDGEEVLCTLRTSTAHQRTADAYWVWFSTLVKHYGIEPMVEGVIISSTVPRVVFNLRVFTDRFFNLRPLVVGRPDCLLPVDVRVDAGTQVGPDRLVNTVAGYNQFGGDLIIVDFGTATTFDVADSDGAYIGGVIAPGVNLSLEALHMAAAALPHVDITHPDRVIGTNTVACMQSGIFWGYVGLIKEISGRIMEEHGRDMKVIGTGGLAPLFQSHAPVFDRFEDNLTMHGLKVIYEHNKELGNL
ncbi:MAG: type III pantothenate kinase [Pseudomonadota bacterium]|nr:type III pantothenate kinase [Pseudomonadota bacterium]